MSEISIPCEVIARLANVLKYFPDSADEWTDSIRLEDNYAMATNRCYMAVERLKTSVATPVHIKADPAFIEQCRIEAQYSSNVFFVVNPMLGMITARTTMGYQYPGNLLLRLSAPNKLDDWKNVIPRTPCAAPGSSLMLDLTQFMMFAETAPSKMIIFERCFNMTMPSIVRDRISPDWFGVFNPKDNIELHDPATLPGWFK